MESLTERLLAALSAESDGIGGRLIELCCRAVGLPGAPCHVATLDDLRQRMQSLVHDMKMAEEFLVPGLLHYSVEYLEGGARHTRRFLERNPLEVIDDLRDAVRTSTEARAMFSDQYLQGMADQMAELQVDLPGYIRECEQAANAARAFVETWFPESLLQEQMDARAFFDD